jgi:hypothetical protein
MLPHDLEADIARASQRWCVEVPKREQVLARGSEDDLANSREPCRGVGSWLLSAQELPAARSSDADVG